MRLEEPRTATYNRGANLSDKGCQGQRSSVVEGGGGGVCSKNTLLGVKMRATPRLQGRSLTPFYHAMAPILSELGGSDLGSNSIWSFCFSLIFFLY